MTQEIRIDQALAAGVRALAKVSESPRLDAELLLCQTLDVARSYLFAHPEDTLDALSARRYDATVARRLDGEPLAYIQGRKEFWSLQLMVSRHTLVPRPDTEVLVQQALNEIPPDAAWKLLDVGTGSGAIALALASERPDCDVLATDISAAAVGIARENARQLDLMNVSFAEGDWLEPVKGQTFDLIVSNPPYIRSDDPALAALKYEPQAALVAGADGLSAIRVLARDSAACLEPGGFLMLEHGAEQQPRVFGILEAQGWRALRNVPDHAGLPRVTVARRPAGIEERRDVGT